MTTHHQAPRAIEIPIPALLASVAIVGSNALALSPMLADIAASLDTSSVMVSRASAGYSGATALAALLLAPGIDRLGPGRVLRLGLLALTVACVASAFSVHWLMLLLAQGVAGIGAGVLLPACYALATATAPKGQDAQTLGRVLAGWSVSLVLGVPIAALISDTLGWRATFAVMAVAAAATALAVRSIPRFVAPPGPRVSAMSLLTQISDRAVAPLLAICLCFMAAFYGVYAFLADTVRAVHGVSATVAGLIALAYGAGFGAASFAGRWVDRARPERVLPVALGIIAAIYLAMDTATTLLPAVLALAVLWGFANHIGLNTLMVLMGRAKPAARGAVFGLNSAVTYAAALVGVAGAGPLYEAIGFAALSASAAALLASAAVIAVLRR